tara:strand:+ start:38 stop:529 length:492 start_codon:yes stop_codon:yes gene_type:complete
MVKEKDFFAGGDDFEQAEILNPTNNLDTKLKTMQDDCMNIYALMISDPHKHAASALDELRRNVIRTAAALMEHGVRIQIPTKERTAEDVMKEAAGELGSMFGAKGVAYGLSFVNRVRENIASGGEEIVIYEDEDGVLYVIDDDGNEIECDEEGNPLEGDDDNE